MSMPAVPYAARLNIDYPDQLDRVTTFLRILWAIPILIVLFLLVGSDDRSVRENGERMASGGESIAGGIWLATILLIVFRARYPRWWFDFSRELTRFGARVGAYLGLLTDHYPPPRSNRCIWTSTTRTCGKTSTAGFPW